jgi:hypothetical protein
METVLDPQKKKPPLLRFDQSKSEQVAVVADKDWWKDHQYRVGGLMRMISRGALIVSGLGVGTHKSTWRMVSGLLGLGAGGFLAAFGEKDKESDETSVLGGLSKEKTGRIYHGIVAASGAAMAVAGFISKSKSKHWWTETIAGIWTMIWSAYAALTPEDKKDAPVFDKGATKATPQGFVDKHAERSLLEEYKKHPKKLASDMLQFSAIFALVDGITRENKPDIARIVSAVTLGASNYLQREMKDADFAPAPTQPLVSR